MGRKVILYIATSLDGFIADKNDAVDWLENLPNPDNDDYNYQSFLDTIDATLMGRKTYETVLKLSPGDFPYKNKTNYVFTTNKEYVANKHVTVLNEVGEPVKKLKEKTSGKNIWLIGGASLNAILLKAGLIDEIILTIAPIVLGDGLSLFGNNNNIRHYTLINHQVFASGFVQLIYKYVV